MKRIDHKIIETHRRELKGGKICTHCKKQGHLENECYKKQNEASGTGIVFLMTCECEDSLRNEWIGDTGATHHIINNSKGLYNIRKDDDEVKIVDGSVVKIKLIGDLNLKVKNRDQQICNLTLKYVSYIPEFWCNLLSITYAIKDNKTKMTNDGRVIILSRGNFKIEFPKIFRSKKGYLGGMDVVSRIGDEKNNMVLNAIKKEGCSKGDIDINDFHTLLGHPNYEVTARTAKYYEIKLCGEKVECGPCGLAKIKMKNIPKHNQSKSTLPGERLYTDISYTMERSYSGSQYWVMIEDETTIMKWSLFLKKKDQMGEEVSKFVKELQIENEIQVKWIRCDNSGENKLIKDELTKLDLKTKMEFTSPHNPQQNGMVERTFAFIYSHVRALLNSTHLSGLNLQ